MLTVTPRVAQFAAISTQAACSSVLCQCSFRTSPSVFPPEPFQFWVICFGLFHLSVWDVPFLFRILSFLCLFFFFFFFLIFLIISFPLCFSLFDHRRRRGWRRYVLRSISICHSCVHFRCGSSGRGALKLARPSKPYRRQW